MSTPKNVKPTKAKPPKPEVAPPKAPVAQVAKPVPKPPTPAMKKAPAKRRPRPKPTSRRREAPKRPVRHPKVAQRRRRGRYSSAKRARILKIATAQKLTAQQVKANFGVKPVTYYSWRKMAKATS